MSKKTKRPIHPDDQRAIDQHRDLAKENFRVAGKRIHEAAKKTGEGLKYTLYGGKKTVDVVDRTLGAKIAPPSKRKAVNIAKNNLIKILVTTGMVTGGANITKDMIEEYQNNKNDKAETEQYVEHIGQVGFTPTGNTFEQGGKKRTEFTYVVTADDIQKAEELKVPVATVVSQKFDTEDMENGDKFGNTGYNNSYDKEGIVGKNLQVKVGDKLFFKAKKINKEETVHEKIKYNAHRDTNNDYFQRGYLLKDETINGMQFRNDAGMCFYKVKKGDNLYNIRKNLSKISKFSYLADKEYGWEKNSRNIKSFNINAKDLKEGLWIPIPMEKNKRETSLSQFRKYSELAVEEMKNDKIYGKAIKSLCKNIGEEKVVNVMLAFARSETTEDWKNFSDNIGSVTYHRWEDHLRAFSFSPYHILMEKNADGKTYGPGLKARINLGLTEGQTYHPKNAGKLFLAYRVEKVGEKKLNQYFDLSKKTKGKIGKKYNGMASYGEKLYANYLHICK